MGALNSVPLAILPKGEGGFVVFGFFFCFFF